MPGEGEHYREIQAGTHFPYVESINKLGLYAMEECWQEPHTAPALLVNCILS